MSMSPAYSKHSTLEKNNVSENILENIQGFFSAKSNTLFLQVSHQNGNGVKYFPPLDNMSLNSEAV